jgi:hypothetical protein
MKQIDPQRHTIPKITPGFTPISSRTFLAAVLPSLVRDETIELRVKDRKNPDYIRQEFLPSIPLLLKAAKKYKGREIWFGVSTRRGGHGKKENCFRVAVVWVDLDKRNDLSVVNTMDPKPNYVVSTGTGLHCYWVLTTPAFVEDKIPHIEAVTRGLSKKFKGDDMAVDVSRILRIPGFLNHKYNPPRKVRAYFIHNDPYSLDYFERRGIYEYEPVADTNIDFGDGNVIPPAKLPEKARTLLQTVSNKNIGHDPSQDDSVAITSMLAGHISPDDVYTTFVSSKRGQNVWERNHTGHEEDYIKRTIRNSMSFLKSSEGKPNGKAEDALFIDADDGKSEGDNFSAEPDFTWLTLNDALKTKIEKPPHVIEDLVYDEGTTGVSAHPHVGKSASWLCATLEAAAGRNVWGHFQVDHAMRTGFIETEDPPWLVYQRIQHFAEGLKFTASELKLLKENFRFMCPGPFNLIQFEDQLAGFLQKHKPRFAVLSTLQGLLEGRHFSDPKDMGPVNSLVVRLSRQLCPIVLITHSPWDKTIHRTAGTVVQEANYTISIHCERSDKTGRMLVWTNSKFDVLHKFSLEFEVENKKLLRIVYHKVTKAEEILACKMKGYSVDEIVAACGVTDRYVREIVAANEK